MAPVAIEQRDDLQWLVSRVISILPIPHAILVNVWFPYATEECSLGS